MNYNRENLSRKKKDISSKRNLQKKRVLVRLFKALVVCIALVCIAGISGVFFFAQRIIANTPSIVITDVLPSGEITTIYANDGVTQIEQLVMAGANRVFVDLDEVPLYLQHAFIAIEDARFFEHNGVDLPGIARAFAVGVTTGTFSEGASTITQQLIKNNVFPDFMDENTFMDQLERKLQEQYLAIAIEQQMTKYEILEAYLNTINLGQSTLGVQAASMRYFNKDVSELTLSESAVIASITQNPTRYDPVVFPEFNAYRRATVLGNMLEQGFITQEQYEYAMADPVYDRIQHTIAITEDDTPYSYFVDVLIEEVQLALMERNGFTETQAFNMLHAGGLRIIATQDLRIQQIAYDEIANDANFPPGTWFELDCSISVIREDGTIENYSSGHFGNYIQSITGNRFPLLFNSREEAEEALESFIGTLNISRYDEIVRRVDISPQPQASVTVMDQHTGHVVAIVGGRGEKSASRSLNRAANTFRQPGSAFKTLGVYPPALNSHGWTLATTVDDRPFRYYAPGDTPGNPTGPQVNNWDRRYRGHTGVRFAIQHSMNVMAVKTLTEIGLESGFEYLQRFGITSLVNFDHPEFPFHTDVAQATALGGITIGVSNLEMTAAHAAIANNGVYIRPMFFSRVYNSNGDIILDNSTPPVYHRVLSEDNAFLMTSAMEDVINLGTGTAARLSGGMAAAGKTGTTEWGTDLWLSAYTPYYTASVWTGFDTNRPMEDLNPQNWHMIIWRNIMNRIHEGMEPSQFTIPPTIERLTVCAGSGYRMGSGCRPITEYFAAATIPARTCSGDCGRRGDCCDDHPDCDCVDRDDDNGDDGHDDGSDHPHPPGDDGDDDPGDGGDDPDPGDGGDDPGDGEGPGEIYIPEPPVEVPPDPGDEARLLPRGSPSLANLSRTIWQLFGTFSIII